MTTLKETLKADLLAALKRGEEGKFEATTLRSALSAVQNAEKSGKSAVEFNDKQVLDSLAQAVKTRQKWAAEYIEKGIKHNNLEKAQERAAIELAEVEVLSRYLPTPLTEEETEAYVDAAIKAVVEEKGTADFGSVMKAVQTASKGRVDGKLTSGLIKAKLA